MKIKGSLSPIAPISLMGKSLASHAHQKSKVPRWVYCDAKEFINEWLPRFEAGELPPCTDAEWVEIVETAAQQSPQKAARYGHSGR